jgi:hypothetical protein
MEDYLTAGRLRRTSGGSIPGSSTNLCRNPYLGSRPTRFTFLWEIPYSERAILPNEG